jgi:subtilisin-like proprotein convertase family protein
MKRALLTAALLALVGASPATSATKTYSSGALHAVVPSGGEVTRTLAVPDRGPVSRVAVDLHVTGPVADLTISLVAPNGKEVVLVRRQGQGNAFGEDGSGCGGTPTEFTSDPYASKLTDDDPPYTGFGYRPTQSLNRLNGLEAKGKWRLKIDSAGGAAALLCWQLDLSRAVVERQTAASRGTRAALSYVETDNRYKRVAVRIARRGRTLVDTPLARLNCSGCPSYGPALVPSDRAVSVRDLDGDGEPEVLVDLYTGGAHCCFFTLIFRYRPDTRTYGRTSAFWGDIGYSVDDLDHDGTPELASADDRFAYAFTAYAFSGFPLRIWQYRSGRLVDATRQFPAEVEADAARQWKDYLAARKDRSADVRGVLAAWLADEYLLGRGDAGWAKLEQAFRRGELGHTKKLYGWPAGRAYLAFLRSFLRRNGYITA